MFKSDCFDLDPMTVPTTVSTAASITSPKPTTTTSTDQTLDGLMEASRLVITEEVALPGRAARYGELPSGLQPSIVRHLETSAPEGIYSYQALALKKFLAGQYLIVSTSTASGKSLIFGATAAQTLLENPGGKVLACYPMKALASDQERKWRTLSEH